MRTERFAGFSSKEHAALRNGRGPVLALAGILVVGLVLRLVFIDAQGFTNDVSTFESWALTLSEHSLRDFYGKAGFADYPPGYFYLLWIVGHAYKLLVHNDPSYAILKAFIKLPAILMDLACGVLLFAIVRAYASGAWALAAAALFVLNPAMIFISAYWGQVDSVACALLLSAIYLIVANDEQRDDRRVIIALVFAWLLLAYSILIKPPASVLVPLFFAYGFAARPARKIGTAIGIIASLCMAYVITLTFHAGWNPIQQFAWLYERYHFAGDVYPYNSVNAFNIYAVRWPFWQPDTVGVVTLFSWQLPQYVLGIITVLVAMGFVLERYLHRRDLRAFLEGGLLLCLAFFLLATRMHERYVFNAVVLSIAAVAVHRRYLYAAIILSITLFANLLYSLWYLKVVTEKLPGYDATDLFPLITHPLALINVLVFFSLAYLYIERDPDTAGSNAADLTPRFAISRWLAGVVVSGRSWFSPLEGTAAMTARDRCIAALLTVLSFLVMAGFPLAGGFKLPGIMPFWLPREKVFDEIYYARAAEEYLKHIEIFEFTHPPLTKLIVTASIMLFGGLAHGDTSVGWRFLNLVIGALMVGVLYIFAKRLTGSTLFATIAGSLLLFDGFHFVQSRIATPEITVAFLSLTTLYLFYRFWLATVVRKAPLVSAAVNRREFLWVLGGSFAAAPFAFWVAHAPPAWIVAFLYFETGVYLVVRLLVPALSRAPLLVSYADGTAIVGNMLHTPDGGTIHLQRGQIRPGEVTREQRSGLQLSDGDLHVDYEATGVVRYATPEGQACFSPDGGMIIGNTAVRGKDGMLWLGLLSVSAGLLAASKWNGLFDFLVIWLFAALVVAQPYIRRRSALWGNPQGFSLDIVIAAMLFVGATIYVLTYIPYFSLHTTPAGHTLDDLVALQKQMYDYHHDLHATHPYSSQWWQWPLLQIPISYYYSDLRHGAATSNPAACCVAEILALPNPLMWWTGLISVPLLAWWAWYERNKGYALLVAAYLFQWLPWILSPRIAFEYHFFPNLAIIVLADTVLLQRLWNGWKNHRALPGIRFTRALVGLYLVGVVAAFVFWYPVVAGTPVSWEAWNARMFTQFEGNNWINPHPGR